MRNIALLLVCMFSLSQNGATETLTGVITDKDSGLPIPHATIQVLDGGTITITNESGEYRLLLSSGRHNIKFSHIAHYSQTATIDISGRDTTLDVELIPSLIEIKGITVREENYDAGQLIILEAIKRKQQILKQLQSFSFEAYTKLVLNEIKSDDSEQIAMLTETELNGYWEYPDNYKEVITGRQQSANIEAAENLVTVGNILNFNANRLDMGQFQAVSPTAKDALDYYDYYLMDTIIIDDKAVFVLDIEPKNDYDPLFAGTILIADSVYAVVGVDVSFGEGFDTRFLSEENYRQEYSFINDTFWMPTSISFKGRLDLPIPIIPKLRLSYVAAMQKYSFDPDFQDTVFNGMVLEVEEAVDDIDSTDWANNRPIPLTIDETDSYVRIDSVENNKPLWRQLALAPLGILFLVSSNDDFFRFNRTEGAYLGMKAKLKSKNINSEFTLEGGYAFDAEKWQYTLGWKKYFGKYRKQSLSFVWRDHILRRETLFSKPSDNGTFDALFTGDDPFDYHAEKGYTIGYSTRLFDHLLLTAGFDDLKEWSLPVTTNYYLYRDDAVDSATGLKTDTVRSNPPIIDGRRRTVRIGFNYDTRDFIYDRGEIKRIYEFPYTLITGGIEKADPSLIDNDFDYTRYHLSLYHSRNMFNLGISSFYLYGGTGNGSIPSQRHFMLDWNSSIFVRPLSFLTLNENSFYGDRVASLFWEHRFDRILFRKTGLDFIPFGLAVHAGMFVVDFKDIPAGEIPTYYRVAEKPYVEVGFGITRLPYLFELHFNWQLSDYETSDFRIMLSNELFMFR